MKLRPTRQAALLLLGLLASAGAQAVAPSTATQSVSVSATLTSSFWVVSSDGNWNLALAYDNSVDKLTDGSKNLDISTNDATKGLKVTWQNGFNLTDGTHNIPLKVMVNKGTSPTWMTATGTKTQTITKADMAWVGGLASGVPLKIGQESANALTMPAGNYSATVQLLFEVGT